MDVPFAQMADPAELAGLLLSLLKDKGDHGILKGQQGCVYYTARRSIVPSSKLHKKEKW